MSPSADVSLFSPSGLLGQGWNDLLEPLIPTVVWIFPSGRLGLGYEDLVEAPRIVVRFGLLVLLVLVLVVVH